MLHGDATRGKALQNEAAWHTHIAAREVSGASADHIYRKAEDTLAERLRRRPAKPMGSPRVGSNPTGVDSLKQKHDNRSTLVLATRQRLAWVQNAACRSRREAGACKSRCGGRSCSTEGHAMGGKSARLGYSRQAWPNRQALAAHSRSISGLVVEYIVAIDVTRDRFPADAS